MKRKSLLFVLPVLGMALAGCTVNPDYKKPGEEEHEKEDEDKVKFEVEEEVSIGVTQTHKIAVEASGGTGVVTYVVTDGEGIIEVDASGTITGIAEGEAVVTVTYNGQEKYCSVTVLSEEDIVHVEKIFVDSTKLTLGVNDTHQIITTFTPEEPTNKGLLYESSNKDVCTVSSSGLITAVGLGSTTVKVTSEDNPEISKDIAVSVVGEAEYGYGTADQPLTVSQALSTINNDCPNDGTLTKEVVYCQGEIKSVDGNWDYGKDGTHDYAFQLTITDGTSDLVVYRVHASDADHEKVVAGATIKIAGYAKNYKGTLEFVDNGSTKCTALSVGGDTPTPPGPTKTVESISIEGSLTKTSYTVGEAYSVNGLSVKAHYTDSTSATVSTTITLDKTTAALGDTKVTASATFEGKTASKEFAVTVSEAIESNYGTADQPLTVTQALATIQNDCPQDNTLTKEVVYCQGEIKSVDGNWDYGKDGTHDYAFQLTITDETTDLIVYRVHVSDADHEKVIAGATIKIAGYGKNFKGTLEFVDNGSTKCTALSVGGDTPTPPGPTKTVESISIEGSLTKTNYTVGEAYSVNGLSVKAHYTDSTSATVSTTITLDKTTAALGDTKVTASATFEGKTASKEFAISVSESGGQGDVITVPDTNVISISAEDLGLSSYGSGSNTNYAWTDLAKESTSNSIQGNYKTGEGAKDSELHNILAFSKDIVYVKLNVGKASGATTQAKGEVRFGSSVQPVDNAIAYGDGTDFSVTEIGSFILNAPTSCKYFSLKWLKGAVYFSSIEIGFGEHQSVAVEGVSLNKTSTSIEVGKNETLIATVTPAEAENKDVTWSSSVEAVATVSETGKVIAVKEGTTVITVETVDGEKTASCTVTVVPASQTGATNIDLKGSSTIVINGTSYENAIKAGTGKVAGTATISVPAEAKKLVIYAAGWNKENVVLTVSGGELSENLTLISDTGVAGSGSTFTLTETDENKFKFEIDVSSLSSTTDLTLTATSGFRFVIWNASYTK